MILARTAWRRETGGTRQGAESAHPDRLDGIGLCASVPSKGASQAQLGTRMPSGADAG